MISRRFLKKLAQHFKRGAGTPVSISSEVEADIRGLAHMFARIIPHAAMTKEEHAQILEAWMLDPQDGWQERLKYARLLDMELAHQSCTCVPTSPVLISFGVKNIGYIRGPMYRDREGYYRVSDRPFPKADLAQVVRDQGQLWQICKNLKIDLTAQTDATHDNFEARRLTEAMMVQLRRHGPNSRYVKNL